MSCVILRILFADGSEREYPVHGGGDWRYTDKGDEPSRIIVRPFGGMSGNDGKPQCRHEIPLTNVLSVMVVPHRAEQQAATPPEPAIGQGDPS